MTIGLVTLSDVGALVADRVRRAFPHSNMYVHENVEGNWDAERFGSIIELTGRIFDKHEGLVFVAPCGVVVRALAPNLRSKLQDPGGGSCRCRC